MTNRKTKADKVFESKDLYDAHWDRTHSQITHKVRVYHEDGWVYIQLPCGSFKTRHPTLLAELRSQLEKAQTELIDFKMTEHGTVPYIDMLVDGSEPPEVYDIYGNKLGGHEEVLENRPSHPGEDSGVDRPSRRHPG